MEVGKQIKKFRRDLNLSQDELADKIFVTRQTISNWENGKNYPDLKSLIMLSQLFDTSLDILVKGDVIKMKKQVLQDDVRKEKDEARRFKRDGNIFTVLLFSEVALDILISAYIISTAPEFDFFKTPLSTFVEVSGIALWLVNTGFAMHFAFRVERQKMKLNIKTFREILSYMENSGRMNSEE